MAWKPRLPPAGTEVVPMERRKWVAVAEQHAEKAVNLFVNIMQNQRLPYKMRMEAATRIVMIAGATFRGERQDGNGRPAANLPAGKPITKLDHQALRAALSQLPPGSVVESPEELAKGEVAVVLVDSEHQRKPTGMLVQTTLGSTVIGQADPEEAYRLRQERLESLKEVEVDEPEEDKEVDPVRLVKKLFKKQAGNKVEKEVIDRRLGIVGDHADAVSRRQEEAKSLPTDGASSGDSSGSRETGQKPKLADAASLEDSQGNHPEVP